MIGRRRVRGRDDGGVDLALPDAEREVIRSLAAELRPIVEGDDPVGFRLRPPAYADQPDLEEEYRSLTADDLRSSRLDHLDTLARTADATTLTADETGAWLTAVNSIRLVLGTRLDVSEDAEPSLEPDDPDAPLWAAYTYLSMLLDELVSATGP